LLIEDQLLDPIRRRWRNRLGQSLDRRGPRRIGAVLCAVTEKHDALHLEPF
jgi:hypothetical protein